MHHSAHDHHFHAIGRSIAVAVGDGAVLRSAEWIADGDHVLYRFRFLGDQLRALLFRAPASALAEIQPADIGVRLRSVSFPRSQVRRLFLPEAGAQIESEERPVVWIPDDPIWRPIELR